MNVPSNELYKKIVAAQTELLRLQCLAQSEINLPGHEVFPVWDGLVFDCQSTNDKRYKFVVLPSEIKRGHSALHQVGDEYRMDYGECVGKGLACRYLSEYRFPVGNLADSPEEAKVAWMNHTGQKIDKEVSRQNWLGYLEKKNAN